MHNLSLALGLCLLICGSLTACGTKGPLYIPEQRYPQKATQPAPQTATEVPALEAPAP